MEVTEHKLQFLVRRFTTLVVEEAAISMEVVQLLLEALVVVAMAVKMVLA
jgi:hypothetical protein